MNIIKLNFKTIVIGLLILLGLGVVIADMIDDHGGSQQATVVPQTGGGPAPDNGMVVPATVGADTSSPAQTGQTTGDGGDDGVGDPAPATATIDPAAKEAATAFTAAWLNTYNVNPEQWRAGVIPRVTADVADDLADADPETVPDGGRVGTVKMSLDSQLTVADVTVIAAAGPAATLGTVHLSVVKQDGTWLISEIDWAAAK